MVSAKNHTGEIVRIMTVTQTSGSVIAETAQHISLSSLFTFGPGLPSTIGISILDDDNYTKSNPGALGYFFGNGATSQVTSTNSQQKSFTYELFQYDPASGQYINSTLGSLNNLVYVAPTGNDHAELLSVFTFKNGTSLDYSNLTDLGDLSIVSQASPAANPGQATPNSICAVAESFVGQVWNANGCQVLGDVIAGLAGSSLPFTALALTSSDQSPVLAQPNGEWIVAYDGRTQANPSYAAVEAMVRPGDIINLAWKNTSQSAGHLFTVVSGSGANAMVIDNEQTGSNSANDGSSSDIIIQPPHSLGETLNQYFIANGGAVPASIEVYRLDTPIITALAAPSTLHGGSSVTLDGLFSAADPAGKAITGYQVYDSASGNVFSVGGTQQSAHSAATAISVGSLGSIALVEATAGGSDVLEVRGFNGTYWGDWQSLTVTASPDLTAAQAIGDAAAGQLGSGAMVADSAQNILASLDSLSALAAKNELTSITLTDSGIPNLVVSAAQASNDAAALNEISSSHTVTVQFAGDASQYSVTAAANGALTVTGNGASYQLSNAAALQFADFTEIVATTPGQPNALTTGNVTALYAAVLDRQPDLAGLSYYQQLLTSHPGISMSVFATDFLQSPEYTGNAAHNYAQSAAGDAQFITDSYANLLHRAPEAGAVAWYQTNVIAPYLTGATPGTSAYASAELAAHAAFLVDFSSSPEFLQDVQITQQNPASAQHWLLLI
jgi:hypothetical protein